MAKKSLVAIHPGDFLAETLRVLGTPKRRSRVPSGCPPCGSRTW
jgi:hypothetical protein